MARGRKGLGIEPLAESIRFHFTLHGKPMRETVDRAPTVANLKWASRHAAALKTAISAGTFDLKDFFPDSKRVIEGSTARTLSDYCKLHLAACGNLAANTRGQFKNALAFWVRLLGGGRAVSDIRHSELKAKVGAHAWPSWRLHNNYLIPLRGVFALAAGDGRLHHGNPMAGIKNMKPVRGGDEPDPWTQEQETLILGKIEERYHPQVFNYFDLAFAEGFRPEEEIEVAWSDYDAVTQRLKVRRVRSGGETRAPKNNTIRVVELSDRGIAAIKRQAKFTRMSKHGRIFENPVTHRPWNSTASQREAYWNPALQVLGLDHRSPYSTRHTCATRMLADGCNAAWCAKQLGHSKEMFFRVYAKWIEGSDQGREVGKRNGKSNSSSIHPRRRNLPAGS
jgi:integrase